MSQVGIADVNFQDRIAKQALIIRVATLPLEHDGVYDLVVFANGDEIDRQEFHVRFDGGPENGTAEEEG